MPGSRFSLSDLGIDEVSVVDRGDNLGADILFWKRVDTGSGLDPAPLPPATDVEGITDSDIQKLIEDELKHQGYTPYDLAVGKDGSVTVGKLSGGQAEGVIKAALSRMAGVFGWGSDELKKAEVAVYTPPDFDALQGQKFVPKITEELSEMVATLTDALMIAANSDDMPANMKRSVGQFTSAVDGAIANWSDGKSAFTKAGRKVSAARMNRLKEVRDTLTGLIDEVAPSGNTDEPAGDQGGEETVDKREDNEMAVDMDALAPEVRAEIEKRDQRIAELEKNGTPAPDPNAETPQPEQSELEKALAGIEDAGTREVLRKIAERGVQAETKVADMEKAAEESVYIAKAREWGFSEPESFGPSWRRVTKGVPEDGDVAKVEAGMAAMRGQAATSTAITDQISKAQAAAGATGDTAMAKANSLAQEMRKANPDMSLEAARSQVWAENPTLREQYEGEQKRTA